MKKHWKLASAILVSAVIITFGTFYYFGQRPTIMSPKKGAIIEAIYGIGTVNARKTFQQRFGVTQTLRKIHAREGDEVKKGQVLLELEEGGIMRAPFDGTITSLPFNVGETVFAQVPIFTMMDLKDRFISVSLEQQGALRIKKGQKARLNFESLRGERFYGVVSKIFPNEGQFLVYIEVPNFPSAVLPGMTADVTIEVGSKEDALLIPVSSLANGRLTIIRSGKKQKIEVKVGAVDGEWAEVVSGSLELSDQILARKK